MKTPIGKKNGESKPPITETQDLPILLGPDPPVAAAAPSAPAAAPVGLTFVRASAARSFQGTVTIPLADLAHIAIGANSGGPNGYGLISYQGRLFSAVGDFTGDDNPAHNPFIGMPVYVEI
jgi:hypothetical protein